MENLISLLIFVLPGFMLYFWIQMMGVTPVVKHTPFEFGALSALAWFPVVAATIGIMSLYRTPVYTLTDLNLASNDVMFIIQFVGISVGVSFLIAVLYTTVLYRVQMFLINIVRKLTKRAPLSLSASVWEEVFLDNQSLVVGIAKIGAEKPDVIGSVIKAARPFEPKRAFNLLYIPHCTQIVQEYNIPLAAVFTDIDSGVHVFKYDMEAYLKADQDFRSKLNAKEEAELPPLPPEVIS